MRNVPDIAVIEIKRLRDDGVKVTDDDVVWLSSLGYKVENPRGQTIEAAGFVDGIRLSDDSILYPLTVCGSHWIGRFGKLFRGKFDTYAVALAMTCPLRVSALKTATESVKAVAEYADALKVEYSELVNAVSRMLEGDAPQDPNVKKSDPDKLIAALVAITGLSFEYWDTQSWIRVNDVYSGAFRYAEMTSGMVSSPDATESKSALRDMLLAIKEIRERK